MKRWIVHCGLVSLALLVAAQAAAVTLQSWVATARIRSGNTTLTDSPDPHQPPAPTDATGFLEANGANIVPPAPIDAGAAAEYDLPNGTIGVVSGFDAVSNAPVDNRIFDPFGGASALYIDDVTVSSGSLEGGTPVTVRFVFDLAWSADAQSSLDEAVASADVDSTAAGVTGLTAADNRYFIDLDSGTLIHNGIFTGDQHAEYTIETTVGATFQFATSVDVSSYGTVRATQGPSGETNNSASGWSDAAIAFGGEVVGANAQLVSALLGGPFPPASAVSPKAAENAVPFNPFYLPEPSADLLGLAALVALAGLRARRSSLA